jgi:hypothetical protein
MQSDIAQKLTDILWTVAATRGVENIKLIHSILVETCAFYERSLGTKIYEKVMELEKYPKIDKSIEQPYRDLYYLFGANIFSPISNPDDPLDNQTEIPFAIEEKLRNRGVSEWDIYSIFLRGIENKDRNRLHAIYSDNEYIKKEGYII